MKKKYKLLAAATVVANKDSIVILDEQQAELLKDKIRPVKNTKGENHESGK